jgi:hypothetical protein
MEAPKMGANTQLTGDTGEFLVAAELSRRGWTTTITMGNAIRTDLFARHSLSGRLISIQVKSRATGTFLTGKNSEELPSTWEDHTLDNEWFVLVSLGEGESRMGDRFFVVPRIQLACFVFVGHRAWLAGKGPGGRPRRDSSMRAVSLGEVEPYENRWDLLQCSAAETPWMLPERWWGHAERHLQPVLDGCTMPARSPVKP